jgi:hypothetical protein
MSSPWTCGSELHTHFITQLRLRFTLSHILTQHSTSTPLPETASHSFTPKQALLRCLLRVDQTPLLPPEAGLNLNPVSYQSDEQGSQVGSQVFPRSFVQPVLPPWLTRREAPSSRSTQSGGAWRGQPSQKVGMLSQ